MKLVLSVVLFLFAINGYSQYVERDIKDFGAKGDGVTNDHEAFIRAAQFFNARGGNGKLIISKGVYIVGKQKFTRNPVNTPVYEGSDLLNFKNIENLEITGTTGTVIKYEDGLRYGSFDPNTGLPNNNGGNFFKGNYIAAIGTAFSIINSRNVTVRNMELNGNSDNIILGGQWGDTGIQLWHIGIYINNSTDLVVDNVLVHHFGLDGIEVMNNTGSEIRKDNILIESSTFDYNGRQGFSWVGGNDITARNCKFNNTGKGKISSAPRGGVDIEAEVGKITNGKFIDCEFVNNSGSGMVADQGPVSNCSFTNCTFWGLTNWSAWVNMPAFTFSQCRFYGSFVHGYVASNYAEATKFYDCVFEDKPYNGQEPYGNFLLESNYRKRMVFDNCTFIAHKKNLFWLASVDNPTTEEKYQFINCKFYRAGKVVENESLKSISAINIRN